MTLLFYLYFEVVVTLVLFIFISASMSHINQKYLAPFEILCIFKPLIWIPSPGKCTVVFGLRRPVISPGMIVHLFHQDLLDITALHASTRDITKSFLLHQIGSCNCLQNSLSPWLPPCASTLHSMVSAAQTPTPHLLGLLQASSVPEIPTMISPLLSVRTCRPAF